MSGGTTDQSSCPSTGQAKPQDKTHEQRGLEQGEPEIVERKKKLPLKRVLRLEAVLREEGGFAAKPL
ncbi:hypothetical protein CsSME_00007083 [Camellia sinensis var. sinensis]